MVCFSTDDLLPVLQLVYLVVDRCRYDAGTNVLVCRPLCPLSRSGELHLNSIVRNNVVFIQYTLVLPRCLISLCD